MLTSFLILYIASWSGMRQQILSNHSDAWSKAESCKIPWFGCARNSPEMESGRKLEVGQAQHLILQHYQLHVETYLLGTVQGHHPLILPVVAAVMPGAVGEKNEAWILRRASSI